MRVIKKEDVIGACIVDIHESFEALDSGCDCREFYFTVSNGLTFQLPRARQIWESVEIPGNATRMKDEFEVESYAVRKGWFGRTRLVRQASEVNDVVKRIKQRTITEVCCRRLEDSTDFDEPDEGVLLFDDGSQLSVTQVAPTGTGAAGLYFFQEKERLLSREDLVDYFTIPHHDIT